jgi:hypothetical protein
LAACWFGAVFGVDRALFHRLESYRTAFEAEASRIIGQPVKVRGDADARLLPFPSVTFSDVVVGEDGRTGHDHQPVFDGCGTGAVPERRGADLRHAGGGSQGGVRVLEDGSLDWALKRKPTPPGDLVVLERVTISDADITIVPTTRTAAPTRSRHRRAGLGEVALRPLDRDEAEGEIAGHRGGVSITTGIAQSDGSIRMRVRAVPDDWPVLLETEGEARIEDNKPSMTACSRSPPCRIRARAALSRQSRFWSPRAISPPPTSASPSRNGAPRSAFRQIPISSPDRRPSTPGPIPNSC